jgi:hypothetical protein
MSMGDNQMLIEEGSSQKAVLVHVGPKTTHFNVAEKKSLYTEHRLAL